MANCFKKKKKKNEEALIDNFSLLGFYFAFSLTLHLINTELMKFKGI